MKEEFINVLCTKDQNDITLKQINRNKSILLLNIRIFSNYKEAVSSYTMFSQLHRIILKENNTNTVRKVANYWKFLSIPLSNFRVGDELLHTIIETIFKTENKTQNYYKYIMKVSKFCVINRELIAKKNMKSHDWMHIFHGLMKRRLTFVKVSYLWN